MFELQHGQIKVVVEILRGELMSSNAFMIQPAAAEPATGVIEVNLIGCEPAFVPTGHDTSKMLYDHCTEIVPETTVDIYDSSGAVVSRGVGSTLTISNVSAGTCTLGVVLAPGYDGFVSYCSEGTSYMSNTFDVFDGTTTRCLFYLTKPIVIG